MAGRLGSGRDGKSRPCGWNQSVKSCVTTIARSGTAVLCVARLSVLFDARAGMCFNGAPLTSLQTPGHCAAEHRILRRSTWHQMFRSLLVWCLAGIRWRLVGQAGFYPRSGSFNTACYYTLPPILEQSGHRDATLPWIIAGLPTAAPDNPHGVLTI